MCGIEKQALHIKEFQWTVWRGEERKEREAREGGMKEGDGEEASLYIEN